MWVMHEPYQPATSRRVLDPSMPYLKSRERKERVLVFPAYDMDLKWLMRLRKECPEGLMKASLSSHGGPCCYWGRGPWGDGFQLRRGRGSYSPRVHGWLCREAIRVAHADQICCTPLVADKTDQRDLVAAFYGQRG